MSSEDNKKPDNKTVENDKDRIPDEALTGVSGGGQREVTRPLIDSYTKRLFLDDSVTEVNNNE